MSVPFARVWLLAALACVPMLIIAYTIDGYVRRRTLGRIGHVAQLRQLCASASPGARRLKAFLTVLAVLALGIALGGPELPGRAHIAPRRGLDLVVLLDCSRSMSASDVSPSRLDRAKAELGRLLDGFHGDRVGVVAFAGVTLSYPLTDDYSAIKLFWRDLGPTDFALGGSDIGLALREGLTLLEQGRGRYAGARRRQPAQAIVLISDGDDTEGTAQQAAATAARRGVKVFTVGVGTTRGEVVKLAPRLDGTAEYVSDAANRPVRMVLDTNALAAIATVTGGDLFMLSDGATGLEGLGRAIAGLERVEEAARVVNEPEEFSWPFLLTAAMLLSMEGLLRERRRAVPTSGVSDPGTRNRPSHSTMALTLLLFWPLLTGFGFFERLSPEVEQGNRLLAAGNAREALAAYERALATAPDDLRLRYNRGSALFALGRYPEAQREFERAMQSADTVLRADSVYNLGNTLLAQDKPRMAVEAYKSTLRLRPTDRHAKWNLELALRRLQQAAPSQELPGEREPPPPMPEPALTQLPTAQPSPPPPQPAPQGAQAPPVQTQASGQHTRPDEPAPQGQSSGGEAAQPPGARAGAPEALPRDTERQDAAAVLDAFEAVEPTVQRELARRRAAGRRARRDW